MPGVTRGRLILYAILLGLGIGTAVGLVGGLLGLSMAVRGGITGGLVAVAFLALRKKAAVDNRLSS